MLQSVSTEDIKTVVVAIYVVKRRISSVDVPVVFGYDGRVPPAIVVHCKSYGKIFKIHCEQAETPTLPCRATNSGNRHSWCFTVPYPCTKLIHLCISAAALAVLMIDDHHWFDRQQKNERKADPLCLISERLASVVECQCC